MFFRSNKLDKISKESVFSPEELFSLVKGKKENYEKIRIGARNGNLSCQVYISQTEAVKMEGFQKELGSVALEKSRENFENYTTMAANQGHKDSQNSLFLFYINQVDESEGGITKKKIECLEEAKYWYEKSNGILETDDVLNSIKDLLLNFYVNSDNSVKKELIDLKRENVANFCFRKLNDDTKNIIDYENILYQVTDVFSNLTDQQIVETRFVILSTFCLTAAADSSKYEGDMLFFEIQSRVIRSLLGYIISAPKGSYNDTELNFLDVTTKQYNEISR